MFGNLFPYFETLDGKVASSLKEIIQRFEPQEKSQSGSAEDSIEMTDSFAEDRSLCMISEYFRVTGTREAILACSDLFITS